MPFRLALCLLLAGCATFPQVDAARFALQGSKATPALIPIDEVNAAAGQPLGAETAQSDLDARAAQLRAEAEALRRQ